MDVSSVTFSFFLIFTGAAIFASIALYTRQPLIIAYIALGATIGPYGLSMVTLCYLRRYLGLFSRVLAQHPLESYPVSCEVVGPGWVDVCCLSNRVSSQFILFIISEEWSASSVCTQPNV